MLRELRLGVRAIYTIVFVALYATSADYVTERLLATLVLMIILLSFVHEFVMLRPMVNGIKGAQNKFRALAVVMALAVVAAGVSLLVVMNFDWNLDDITGSMRTYSYWTGFYAFSFGAFLAGAVVRRSMQHNRVV